MKVLVLTHLDATNYSIAKIVEELIRRGHYVEGFGYFTDEHNVKMFDRFLQIRPIEELTDEHIYSFDVIFAALDVMERVRHIKRYIFCYNFLFSGHLIADCGDFMFTQCENRRLDYEEDCASMAIGNPKVIKKDLVVGKSKKQILFIDSGHYPFGKEGKKVLANLLLSIAEKFSEYTIKIKPRFLSGDKNVTHKNTCHLYDVITEQAGENIPINLCMLQQHMDMNELIQESSLVLCLYTTAYIDVALCNKPLIIIEGIPNDDTFDLRNNYHWRMQRDVMKESGCMCHYSRVLEHIPEGFLCREEHLSSIVKYTDHITERTVNVMEYIWEEYIKKDLFPAMHRYDYENYANKNIADYTLDWKKIISKRYKNALCFRSRSIDFVDVDCAKKQYMELISFLDKLELISKETYNELCRILDYFRNKIWISNKDKLWSDAINQSFYLWALFENRYYDEIKKVKKEEISCTSQFDYIMGRILFDEGQYEEAIAYLKEYLALSRERGYLKYFTDLKDRQVSGEYFMGVAYYKIGRLREAYNQFMTCEELTDNRHNKAAEYIEIIQKNI